MPANTIQIIEGDKETVSIVEEEQTVSTSGTPLVEITTATEEKIEVVSAGMVGPAGFGSDAYEVFNQSIPSASWTINHSLSKMPSVTVVDSADNIVEGSVQYITDSQIKITFSSAFSGKAYMN